jgi:D-sedoheptulose 7-phosphate isomerase
MGDYKDVNEKYLVGEAVSFIGSYIDRLTTIVAALDALKIAELIEIFLKAREDSSQIFFIGNGGSASTASHFANDLALGTGESEAPFRALSLCDNSSEITAIANDYGYNHIFKKQLEKLMKKGDVVLAISASGNSPNVIEAVEYANAHGGITVGLTGFDGGKLKNKARLVVHVPTKKGEYGVTEDSHLVVDHVISGFLKKRNVKDNI